MHFLPVDTPVNVYLKLPVTEISKIDDQRSVSNTYIIDWYTIEREATGAGPFPLAAPASF